MFFLYCPDSAGCAALQALTPRQGERDVPSVICDGAGGLLQGGLLYSGALPPNPHQRALPFGNRDFYRMFEMSGLITC